MKTDRHAAAPEHARQPDGSASILLVEDEKATSWALAQGLADEGYTIATVTRGEDALHCIDRGDYRLLISDVRLPGIDGIDLARAVTRNHPRLPVILITAYDTPDLRERAARVGVADVFHKPFRLSDIKASVRLALLRVDESQGGAQAA